MKPIVVNGVRYESLIAAARAAGKHPNTIRYNDRKRRDRCGVCGARRPRAGQTRCATCSRKVASGHAAGQRALTTRKREAGTCTKCTAPVAKGRSTWYCPAHLKQIRVASTRWHREKWVVKPFTRIRVSRWGVIRASNGVEVVLSRQDGPSIVQRSGEVLIDIEFRAGIATTLKGVFEAAMGVCRLEASQWARHGLQAVDIAWNREAIALLKRDEFAYLVPAFEFGAVNRVERVIGLALTNSAIDGWPTIQQLLDEQEQDERDKVSRSPRPRAKPRSAGPRGTVSGSISGTTSKSAKPLKSR
jgi:hypothetical protein